MPIRLNGSTSGYTELNAPAVAGSNTLVLPTGNGTANQFLKNGSTAGSLGWSSMVEDSSGRLLVGTSSSSQNTTAVLQGSSGGSTIRSQLILALGNNAPADGDTFGICSFSDSGHAPAAWMFAARDGGTWTSGSSQPTRLVFSTTADGASSPTERFRISSTGAQSSVIPGGSTLYPQFACRAWVNFDGTTATPSTIRASGNVSSVTKNGTGDYTVNFSTSMADTNYQANVSTNGGGAAAGQNPVTSCVFATKDTGGAYSAPATSSFRMVMYSTRNNTYYDPSYIGAAIFR